MLRILWKKSVEECFAIQVITDIPSWVSVQVEAHQLTPAEFLLLYVNLICNTLIQYSEVNSSFHRWCIGGHRWHVPPPRLAVAIAASGFCEWSLPAPRPRWCGWRWLRVVLALRLLLWCPPPSVSRRICHSCFSLVRSILGFCRKWIPVVI